MSLETLKILIESACFSGQISDEDRQMIEQKAKQSGISEQKVDEMIKEALEKASKEDEENLESGFISIDEDKESKKSQPDTDKPELEKSKFTNVKPLSFQGAMSTVYQAKLHGKWIIIKRIKSKYKDNPKYKELFLREFENAYHLDHPHIVRILDKGEDKEGLFYTMEYVDGRTLNDIITKNGLRNKYLAEKIIRQLLDALSYVHKKQIFHRDLKPDNIYVTFKGDNVKVLDFGLAAADYFEDDLLKVGTPRYAAPEQMKKGYDVDQRADIYSLGKIFLELLTGDVDSKNVSKIQNPAYKHIIQHSTKEKPDERFYDCDEILQILNNPNLIKEAKEDKEPVKKQKKKKEKKSGTQKKFPWKYVIIGVAVLAVLTGIYFIFFTDSGKNIIKGNDDDEKNNEKLMAKADSLAKIGKFDKAIEVYTSIEPKNDQINNKIDNLESAKNKLSSADSLFNEKYLVKAMKFYNDLKNKYIYFEDLNDKYEKCLKIYQNAELENFEPVQYTSSANAQINGLWGFKDNSNDYIIVDYKFDFVDKSWKWYKDYAKLIPVKKDGNWGFITSKKEVANFDYSKVESAKPFNGHGGVIAEKNGVKYHIRGDEDGVLVESKYY